MKKVLLAFILSMFTTVGFAASYYTQDVINAMKMYKARNYTECLQVMHQALEKDPSNVVAYYYVGLSQARLGEAEKAKEAYERVISLNTSSQLTKYAKDGIICIDTPENCPSGITLDPAQRIITEINYKMEKEKINTIKSTVNNNRSSSNVPREYVTDLKDFSSPDVQKSEKERYKQLEKIKNSNDASKETTDSSSLYKKSEATSQTPSKEEIADAFDTLKRAGYMNFNPQAMAMQYSPEMMQMNMLMGMNGMNYNNTNEFSMYPYMMYSGQNQNYSPEMIKSMMMSSMVNSTMGFNDK